MSGVSRQQVKAQIKASERQCKQLRGVLLALAGLLGSSALEGCVVVGASSRGGFFVWPGGLGLLVLLLAVVFLLRRR